MRYLFLVLIAGVVASSCTSTKSVSKSPAAKNSGSTPVFLDNIVIGGDEKKPESPLPSTAHIAPKKGRIILSPDFDIEYSVPEQFQYAIKMDVEVEKLANANLYQFINYWWGTPYRLGGSTERGIDCSAFTQRLFSNIYSVQVPRTASEQKVTSAQISKRELKEGDLVFFITSGKRISHVGVYLHDSKFVHASSSSGVMISSLDENYWSKRFAGAGRVVEGDYMIQSITLSGQ